MTFDFDIDSRNFGMDWGDILTSTWCGCTRLWEYYIFILLRSFAFAKGRI